MFFQQFKVDGLGCYSYLIGCPRPPVTSPRLPAPIDSEAFAMPSHQRLGMDNVNQPCVLGPHPQEPGEDQAIRLGKAGPFRCCALENLDLMP